MLSVVDPYKDGDLERVTEGVDASNWKVAIYYLRYGRAANISRRLL